MNLPGISCYCCTLSRPAGMLGEAVFSFLEQDYPGPKELLIFNNDPKQTVVFEHPEVTIINCERPGATLGAMMNEAISLCKYDLLATWEDDDIYLPWRLSFSQGRLNDAPVFRAFHAFYMEFGEIKDICEGLWHSSWLFSRAAFEAAGGYPDDDVNCDWRLWDGFQGQEAKATRLKPAEIYYIYRWGSGSCHLSGFGTVAGARQKAIKFTEDQRARGEVVSGDVRLAPAWKQDYVAQAKEWILTHG